MKKTFTLLSLTLLAILGTLEAEASKLFLRTQSHHVSVFIDGQTYFSNNGDFRLDALRPGNHRIIVRERSRSRNNPRGFIVFNGRIHIPNRSVVFARITPRGRLIIDEVGRLSRPNNVRPPARQNQNWEYRNRNNRYHRGSNFNAALRTIEDARFESSRLDIAKQYIRTNPISSRQVLDVMNLMNFESTRLEIAKFAYRYTWDKENYFIVHQGFRFSSSSKALNRFLR